MTPKSRRGETSPLLPKPANNNAQPLDLNNVVVPEIAVAPPQNGDVEHQPVNDDSTEHKGLPEVRKRMKYIFPALAIGVSTPVNLVIGKIKLTTISRSS
jgi:hypothetical protein